jgi:hypothetical protein
MKSDILSRSSVAPVRKSVVVSRSGIALSRNQV